MKSCDTCQEQFADRFSFCPFDGIALDVAEPITAKLVTETEASSSVSSGTGAKRIGAGSHAPAQLDEVTWEGILEHYRVPRVSPSLDARVQKTLIQIVVERAKADLKRAEAEAETDRKKVEAEIEATSRKAEATLKQRRLYDLCLVGTCLLMVCVIAFLVFRGRINLPSELVWILLGLLCPAIGKGGADRRLRANSPDEASGR